MQRTENIKLNNSLEILLEPNYHTMLDLFESKPISKRKIQRELKSQYIHCPTSIVFGRALISYGLWFAVKNPKSVLEDQREYCAKVVRNVYEFSSKLIPLEETRKEEIRKVAGRLYSLSAEEIIGRINGRNNQISGSSGRTRTGNLPRSYGVNVPPIFRRYGDMRVRRSPYNEGGDDTAYRNEA